MIDRQQKAANGTFNAWQLSLWGSAMDAALAQPYKLPNDAQIQLPRPPNAPPEPSSAILSTVAPTASSESSIKSFARPTEHLPDDHGEAIGEAHETFDDLRQTSTPVPGADENAGRLASLLTNSSWLIAVAVIALLVPACLVAILLIRRRRRGGPGAGRAGYFFESVPIEDVDGHRMRSLERGHASAGAGAGGRTKALYDAFALDDSEEEDDVDDPRLDDSYMSSFLVREGPSLDMLAHCRVGGRGRVAVVSDRPEIGKDESEGQDTGRGPEPVVALNGKCA